MAVEPHIIILAGGLGTRLGKAGDGIPKSMVAVADAPFIDHQLRLLHRKGITNVVLCLSHRADQIVDFVGDGSRYRLNISFSEDGAKLLGTGGAIKKALPLVPDRFGVLYGDSYLDLDYSAVWTRFFSAKQLALMTVMLNDNQWNRSNVAYENGMVMDYNKENPSSLLRYIDYGFTMFSQACFDEFAFDRSFDLADVFKAQIMRGQMAGYEVSERFYEIGTPAGLEETDRYLRTRGQIQWPDGSAESV